MNDERRCVEPVVHLKSESTDPGDAGHHGQLDTRGGDKLLSHSSINDIHNDNSQHVVDASLNISSPDLPQPTVDADQTPSPPTNPQENLATYDASPPQDQGPYRVRFRSRVRIASGIHRERPDSLSPSSSISAPLRSQTDLSTSTLGPLGQRTHILSRGRDSFSPLGAGRTSINVIPWERTPLKRSSPYVNIDDHRYIEYYTTDAQGTLSVEMDEIFGKWPKRLLNPCWWWWQLEPLICCHSCRDLEDLDD